MLHSPNAPNGESIETKGSLRTVDVSRLFREFGIRDRIIATMNDNTYDVDPDEPRNNWLYPAFRGFEVLKKRLDNEGRTCDTFASIGTGSGLDGVYGQKVFQAKRVVLSDLLPDVVPLAEQNARKNIPTDVDIIALTGSLCAPLREAGVRANVMYANLPLIPDADVMDGMRSSTYVLPELIAAAPEEYKRHLLGMKYVFLKDAVDSLAERGNVVITLGGRVPVELVVKMFSECGYSYEELFTMLKLQMQPQQVLPGFVEAERTGGVEFDFYALEAARATIGNISTAECGTDLVKRVLLPHRVNAQKALELHEQGQKIGHIVQVIRGQRL